jgi:uncharacterized membrane protein YhaH (DUF805 family)
MTNTNNINNPYAPPATTVADVFPDNSVAFQPVKIFGTKGRIGRLRYLTYAVVANIITGTAWWISALIMALLTPDIGNSGGAPPPLTTLAIVGIIVIAIWLIIAVVFLIFLTRFGIQRSHDMNMSGWAALLTWIPLVAFIWMLIPGTQGTNRFGPPPPPNNASVYVAAGISAFFMVVGIMIMVIFMVAGYTGYQKYQQRTHEAAAQGQQQ